MKKKSIKRGISLITTAGFLCLSIVQPVLAFESFNEIRGNGDAKIYGVSLTGDFDFSRVSVNSFAYVQTNGVTGSFNDDGIVSFSDGMLKTDLPLLTFGSKVSYPGILYNQNGEQFINHIVAATEGNTESQTVIWPYVLGGIVVVGGIVALIASSSSSNEDEPQTTPNAVENKDTPPDDIPQPITPSPQVVVPEPETYEEVPPIEIEPEIAQDATPIVPIYRPPN